MSFDIFAAPPTDASEVERVFKEHDKKILEAEQKLQQKCPDYIINDEIDIEDLEDEGDRECAELAARLEKLKEEKEQNGVIKNTNVGDVFILTSIGPLHWYKNGERSDKTYTHLMVGVVRRIYVEGSKIMGDFVCFDYNTGTVPYGFEEQPLDKEGDLFMNYRIKAIEWTGPLKAFLFRYVPRLYAFKPSPKSRVSFPDITSDDDAILVSRAYLVHEKLDEIQETRLLRPGLYYKVEESDRRIKTWKECNQAINILQSKYQGRGIVKVLKKKLEGKIPFTGGVGFNEEGEYVNLLGAWGLTLRGLT